MELPKGFVKILEEDCKGCGFCVDACPENTLEIGKEMNSRGYGYVQQTNIEDCTGCTLCYIQCPGSAIIVYRLAKK